MENGFLKQLLSRLYRHDSGLSYMYCGPEKEDECDEFYKIIRKNFIYFLDDEYEVFQDVFKEIRRKFYN